MSDFLKKHAWYFALSILAVFAFLSFSLAEDDSATFDEIAHIPAGYTYLTEHEMRLNPEHPPLIKNLIALPLLFLNLEFDTASPFWQEAINGQWDAGKDFLYHTNTNDKEILFWARIPIVLLSIFLGVFLFWWSKRMFGPIFGLITLSLYAFDPNILGHNHFVTTDLGIAFAIIGAIYFIVRYFDHPSWKNILFAGIFLGLAQLTKFTALFLLPLLVIFIFFAKSKDTSLCKFSFVKAKLLHGLSIGFVMFCVIWIGYFLNTFAASEEHLNQTIQAVIQQEHTLPLTAISTQNTLLTLNDSSIARPFAEYFMGVVMVSERVNQGNQFYFLETVSSDAKKMYFPIVFVIKETLPFLILLLLSALYLLFRSGFFVSQMKRLSAKNHLKTSYGFVQRNILWSFLFAFVLLYSYSSITNNLNIGFRHLFPILPALYLLVTKAVFEVYKHLKSTRSEKAFQIFLLCIMLWYAVGTLLAYPYYLSYFNKSVGGPKNGYTIVTDSNSDWGQDLWRLEKWIDEYQKNCDPTQKILFKECSALRKKTGKFVPLDTIRVNYFGGSNPEQTLQNVSVIPWWGERHPIEPGWYAISAGFLQESLYRPDRTNEENYSWLLNHEPVAQIGTSIFVYYIEE